jgi:hypothetical protein
LELIAAYKLAREVSPQVPAMLASPKLVLRSAGASKPRRLTELTSTKRLSEAAAGVLVGMAICLISPSEVRVTIVSPPCPDTLKVSRTGDRKNKIRASMVL